MKIFILYLATIASTMAGLVMSPSGPTGFPGIKSVESVSHVQLQDNTNELKIAVTPPEFDDMGLILDSMDWKFTEIMSSELANYDRLAQFDVIFINCSKDVGLYSNFPEFGRDAILANLERFVREGGTLYASDWAFEYIDKAFPGYIHYYPEDPLVGRAQSVTADIVDSGLANFFNSPTVEILFNMDSWVPIESVEDSVKVYMSADILLTNGTIADEKPLVASFAYGEGRVVYTAYHNEGQTTEDGTRLMNYLVFVTTTEELSAALQENMTASGYATQQELLGSINTGDTSTRYTFINPSITDLAVGLNWQEGTLGLSVFKPDGSLYAQQDGSPPLIMVIPNAEAGDWSYQLDAIEVPHENYPYVVQLSVPAIVAATPSATPESPAGIVQVTPSVIPDNSAEADHAPGNKGRLIFIVGSCILCLLALLFAGLLIGVVVMVIKRRNA